MTINIKENKMAETKNKWEMIEDIFNNWELLSSVPDEAVASDVKDAMHEAFMRGCLCGSTDSSLVSDAIDFFDLSGEDE